MGALEKFQDRASTDWAHPEIAPLYQRLCVKMEQSQKDTVLNTDISFEQRQEMLRIQNELMMQYFPARDLSRRVSFWADPVEEEPDAPRVELVAVEPTVDKTSSGCIYYIPGGGLYTCLTDLQPLELFADTIGVTVVSIRYRHVYDGGGYPKAVNDIHAGYAWIQAHGKDVLGINPDKVVFVGESSGSHLALATCHRLKRHGWCGCKPRGVVSMASIVDERMHYPSSTFINYNWASEEVDVTSRLWLGRSMNPAFVPAEAFPNHASAEDCIGLPPTFIHTDEHDSEADPCCEYASKLSQAGVYTELHRWGGSGHGILSGEMAEYDSDYMRRFLSVLHGNIRDCLQYDLRRSWLDE